MITRKSLALSLRPVVRIPCQIAKSSFGRSLYSSPATAFAAQVAEKRCQVYVSKLDNPYVNLSIEHYLLQKSHKESAVLFLYINRPSIVLGRNQNPWLEVDLKRIRQPKDLYTWSTDGKRIPAHVAQIDLVRRRSGGGTVFHDAGNVNYCVISPNSSFTRDKHAEMVVRAIRNGLSPRARVNERHDIVLDQGDDDGKQVDAEDTHATPFGDSQRPPLKTSGSAYKMVRDRTLHHGTCLVNSPNLTQISGYLRSPAAAYIQALGVDSVRTPVSNITETGLSSTIERFQQNVIEQFLLLYNGGDVAGVAGGGAPQDESEPAFEELNGEHIELPDIQKGIAELETKDWIYGQTPRFTLSNQPNNVSTMASQLGDVSQPKIHLASRHGVIDEAIIQSEAQLQLVGRKIHEVTSFKPLISRSDLAGTVKNRDPDNVQDAGQWLDDVFATKRE